MSRKTIGDATLEGWTLAVHIQAIKPDGTQASITSHALNGLDNEAADAGAEDMIEAIKGRIHAYQELKKKGYPPKK